MMIMFVLVPESKQRIMRPPKTGPLRTGQVQTDDPFDDDDQQ